MPIVGLSHCGSRHRMAAATSELRNTDAFNFVRKRKRNQRMHSMRPYNGSCGVRINDAAAVVRQPYKFPPVLLNCRIPTSETGILRSFDNCCCVMSLAKATSDRPEGFRLRIFLFLLYFMIFYYFCRNKVYMLCQKKKSTIIV